MMKNINKVLSLVLTGSILSGCLSNVGGTGGPTINAAVISNSCLDMVTDSQCTIQITYNTNNQTGIVLGYTLSLPSQFAGFTINPSFSNGFQACANQVLASTGGQQNCSMIIVYTTTGTPVSESLVFTLGTASSNIIQLSGN